MLYFAAYQYCRSILPPASPPLVFEKRTVEEEGRLDPPLPQSPDIFLRAFGVLIFLILKTLIILDQNFSHFRARKFFGRCNALAQHFTDLRA